MKFLFAFFLLLSTLQAISQDPYEIAKKYLSEGQMLKADSAAETSIKYFEKHDKASRFSQSLFLLGYIRDELGYLEDACKLYFRALENNPNLRVEIHSHQNIAIIFKNNDMFDRAESHYKEALDVATSSDGGEKFILSLNYNLGNLYAKSGKLSQAVEKYIEVMDVAITNKDTSRLARVYNQIALSYKKADDPIQSREFLFKAVALTDLDSNKFSTRRGIVYQNLGDNYFNEKEFEKAIFYFGRALKFKSNNRSKYFTLLDLGKAYYSLSKFHQAQETWIKAISIYPENPNRDHAEIYKFLAEIAGDDKTRISYLKTYSNELSRILDFDTVLKDEDEKVRFKIIMDKYLSDKISQEKEIRNYIIIGLLLVLAMFIFLYFRGQRYFEKRFLEKEFKKLKDQD